MTMMLAALAAAGIQDAPVTEAAACTRVTRAAEEEKPNLPMMVDVVTRLDEIHYDCGAKTYVMVKTIIHDLSNFREGWQDRQQAGLNEVVCESSLREVYRLGWKFIQKVRFRGGEEFTTVVRCD